MQQRPLYIRVRSILEILSTLWLVSAVIGVGFFSGGTTSLAFSLILLYGTGAALLVVITALYRVLSRAARQRVEAVPEDNAAAVFVDTARSATEEILAALRPAVYGRPGTTVRMPSTVDALDVAAALTARTAAMTSAVAAEKSAAAAAEMVSAGKPAAGKSVMNKSAVNKSAGTKKAAPKQPAQPRKAQTAKSRPANNNGSRVTGNQSSTAPKKSAGGKKPGSDGKGAGGNKAAGSAAGTTKPERAAAPEANAASMERAMNMPGIRTAQQDILPRQTGAPSCGLAAGASRPAGAGSRQLIAA